MQKHLSVFWALNLGSEKAEWKAGSRRKSRATGVVKMK